MQPDLSAFGGLLQSGRFDAALRMALRWTSPDPAASLFQQGAAALKRQDAFAAVAAFEALQQHDPNFPGLADGLATAYRRDALYEKCLALGGNSRQIRYEQGMASLALGLASAADGCFAAILEDDPNHAASWVGRHAAQLELSGLGAAQDCLWRAVNCLGANGRYWALLAAYDLLQGRDHLLADHITPYPARHALIDGLRALMPYGVAEAPIFGLSASLLRHAMSLAVQPGLVLEFGVRRGTSLRCLAQCANQTVHGFDSFAGLPVDWNNRPAGLLTTGLDLPAVPDTVHLHPGWFHETVPAFLAADQSPLRLVNMDSDIYESTAYVLDALSHRIQPGSLLIFDEMIGNRSWAMDEFRAWSDHAARNALDWRVVAVAPATKQVAVRVEAV